MGLAAERVCCGFLIRAELLSTILLKTTTPCHCAQAASTEIARVAEHVRHSTSTPLQSLLPENLNAQLRIQ